MADIILVEDSASLAQFLISQLGVRQHTIHWCITYSQALSQIKLHTPDLILLSYLLPNGRLGTDLIRLFPTIPSIVIVDSITAQNDVNNYAPNASSIPSPIIVSNLVTLIDSKLTKP